MVHRISSKLTRNFIFANWPVTTNYILKQVNSLLWTISSGNTY